MNQEDFDKIVERRLILVKDTLCKKGKEYAPDHDKLHNFKAAASLLGCTPEEALLGFLTKHIISVVDMVKAGGHPAPYMADEKIGDCINYLILLESIWDEKRLAPVTHFPTVSTKTLSGLPG
jgi:hypothetical protein